MIPLESWAVALPAAPPLPLGEPAAGVLAVGVIVVQLAALEPGDCKSSVGNSTMPVTAAVTAAMAAVMAASGFGWATVGGPPWTLAAYLGLACSLGAAVYAAVLLGLWTLAGRPRGAETDLLDALRRLLQSYGGRLGRARKLTVRTSASG